MTVNLSLLETLSFDDDGFMTNTSLNKGVLGWKGQNPSSRGAYLWFDDAISFEHPLRKVYDAGDTIDATIVQGTSLQGQMKIYVVIQRCK